MDLLTKYHNHTKKDTHENEPVEITRTSGIKMIKQYEISVIFLKKQKKNRQLQNKVSNLTNSVQFYKCYKHYLIFINDG